MGKTSDISRILRRVDSIEEIMSHLDFATEELVSAAQSQPSLYMKAAAYRVAKLRELAAAEAELSMARADKAAKFRADRKEVGDRITEGQVQERLARDSKIIELEAAVADAEAVEEYAKLLVEAFRHRRDALKIVVDQVGAEMYVAKMGSGESSELGKIKAKLDKKYPGR